MPLQPAPTQHSGLAVWRLRPEHTHTSCVVAPVRLQALLVLPGHVYRMACVPFNVPDIDEYQSQHQRSGCSFRDLFKPSNPPIFPVALLDTMWRNHNAGQQPALMPYLKDIEAHNMWVGPDMGGRRPVQPVRHMLNTNLFVDDRRNLLRCVASGQRDFSGFLTSFSYCKVSGSFFCGAHVELLFAPFYSYCWEGGDQLVGAAVGLASLREILHAVRRCALLTGRRAGRAEAAAAGAAVRPAGLDRSTPHAGLRHTRVPHRAACG